MTLQEREYYRERADAERVRAATATKAAAEIHLELARLYEKLIEVSERGKATLSIVA